MKRKIFQILIFTMLFTIISSILIVQSAKAAVSTIYIKSDGSIDPSTTSIKTDGTTYTFTADIVGSIVIQKNGITLDGAGYALSGDGTTDGISLTDTTSVTIKNLIIDGFYEGIISAYMHTSSYNTITNNILRNNKDGIVLYSATNYVISYNQIIDCTFQDGIWIRTCSNCEIHENDIKNNPRSGIVLATGSINNIITDNNLISNADGIRFGTGSNTIYHNNFINNGLQQALMVEGINTNVWDNGYPSGGNYWSDYTGSDQTGSDGIGDTAYIIDSYNQDLYPFVKPLSITEQISYLKTLIDGWNLPKKTENSLISKLDSALTQFNRGKEDRSVQNLLSFIKTVEALKGKSLNNWQADLLIDRTQTIIQLIQQ